VSLAESLLLAVAGASGARLVASEAELLHRFGRSPRKAVDRLEKREGLLSVERSGRGKKNVYTLTEAGIARAASLRARDEGANEDGANEGTKALSEITSSFSKSKEEKDHRAEPNHHRSSNHDHQARGAKRRTKDERSRNEGESEGLAIAREALAVLQRQTALLERVIEGTLHRDLKPARFLPEAPWTPTPSPPAYAPSAPSSTPASATTTAVQARASLSSPSSTTTTSPASPDAPSVAPARSSPAVPPRTTHGPASAPPATPRVAPTTPSDPPSADEVGHTQAALAAIVASDRSPKREELSYEGLVARFDETEVVRHVKHYLEDRTRDGGEPGCPTRYLLGGLNATKKGKPWSWLAGSTKTWRELVTGLVGEGLKLSPSCPELEALAPPPPPKPEPAPEPVDPDPVGSFEREIELGREAARLRRMGDRRSLTEILLALRTAPPPTLQQVPHGEGRRPEPAGEPVEAEAIA
jgi:DNA-binding PadR family transcriptional regulator